MNYYNVFIIIFAIDVFIYLIEGLMFFLFIKKYEDNTAFTQCKLSNIGSLFLPSPNKDIKNLEPNIQTFKRNILHENDHIITNQKASYIYFLISFLFLIGIIIAYYYIVTLYFRKTIDLKTSLYIAGFCIGIILVIELLCVKLVIIKRIPFNPIEFKIQFNNTVLNKLINILKTKKHNPEYDNIIKQMAPSTNT